MKHLQSFREWLSDAEWNPIRDWWVIVWFPIVFYIVVSILVALLWPR